ncbi:MAG: hypothetical protein C5B54_04885, partial [Acidobacteria bacterium]
MFVSLLIAFAACQKSQPAAPLVRLGELASSPQYRLRITAATFHPYEGEGWETKNNLITAIQKSAGFHLSTPENSDSIKFGFKARCPGASSRNLKIFVQGKGEINSLKLQKEWNEFQITIPRELFNRDNTNLRFGFGGKQEGDAPFAEFEFFTLPGLSWSPIRIGNDERWALQTIAESQLKFPLTVPGGSPHLFFAAGLPDNGTGPEEAIMRISVNRILGKTKLFEHSLTRGPWQEEDVDLSAYAGKSIDLEFSSTSKSGDRALIAWASPEIYDTTHKNEHLNVILFSIDTMRADRVSYYGYGTHTTPS